MTGSVRRSADRLESVLEELPQPFGKPGVSASYNVHGHLFVVRSGCDGHDDAAGIARSPLEGVALIDVGGGQLRGDGGGVSFVKAEPVRAASWRKKPTVCRRFLHPSTRSFQQAPRHKDFVADGVRRGHPDMPRTGKSLN